MPVLLLSMSVTFKDYYMDSPLLGGPAEIIHNAERRKETIASEP